MTNLNLQQEKLKRAESDVNIEQENRLIEAQTKKAELSAEKAEFESKIRKGIKKAEEERIKRKLEEERLDKEYDLQQK